MNVQEEEHHKSTQLICCTKGNCTSLNERRCNYYIKTGELPEFLTRFGKMNRVYIRNNQICYNYFDQNCYRTVNLKDYFKIEGTFKICNEDMTNCWTLNGDLRNYIMTDSKEDKMFTINTNYI